MQRNFKIRTSITSPEILAFTNALFNTYRLKFGYLAFHVQDNTIKTVEFTLCGHKGLNKQLTAKVEGFIHGWFFGRGLSLYHMQWVN